MNPLLTSLSDFDIDGLTYRYSEVCTFAHFNPRTAKQKAALEACREWATRFDLLYSDGDGALILCGPCGTGKSHLAAASMLAVAIDAAERMMKSSLNPPEDHFEARDRVAKELEWAPYTDLAGRLLDARKAGRKAFADLLDKLNDRRLILIDDLMPPRCSDEATAFAEFIDYRHRTHDYGISLIVTTNMTPSEMKTALGDRTFDRIRENAILRPLDGASYRARNGWDGLKLDDSPTTTEEKETT